MRVTLMHNAGAGEEDHASSELVARLSDAGHRVLCARLDDEGWEEVLRAPADLVVAAGGDGTVGAVFLAVPEGGPAVTLLPLGSANNIARTLGLADRAVDDLARAWHGAPRRPFDVGRVRAGGEERRFVEAVGGGVFAELLVRAGEAADDPSGGARDEHGLGLLRRVLREAPARRWSVVLDGVDLSGDYLAVEAMNIREVGPNVEVAPGAEPGDGLIHLVLVGPDRRDALLHVVEERLAGRAAPAAGLPARTGRALRIGAPEGCSLHIDDALWDGPAQEAEVTLEAGRLEVAVPWTTAPGQT